MISRVVALSLLSAVMALPAAAQTVAPSLGAPTVPDAGFSAPATPPTVAPVPDAAAAASAAKPKPRAKPRAVAARETAIPTDPTPTYTPDTMVATALASEKYLAIVEAGGWPRVQALAPGAKGPAVAALRRRLVLTDDLPASADNGGGYDADVTAGVKRFQMRHGLRQSGTVSGRTLDEMNVSAAQRFRQLASSAQRLAGSQFPFGQRYVVVNIPSAFVEATENGQVVRRYVAVVGKADRASPVVETRITTVNLNPTWTVPTSIIKKDIVPKMQKDPGYLARSKIRLLDGSGQEVNPRTINWSSERTPNFTFRQDPGAGNSLGQMRIDMPNKHAVYMHDTPSKKLFSSDSRFHSSGCVRVENVRDFAVWLLGPQGGWSRAGIDEGIADKERKDIRLRTAVPVAWVYMTGYAMADGSVHFRPDVYGWDKVGGSVTASQSLVQ